MKQTKKMFNAGLSPSEKINIVNRVILSKAVSLNAEDPVFDCYKLQLLTNTLQDIYEFEQKPTVDNFKCFIKNIAISYEPSLSRQFSDLIDLLPQIKTGIYNGAFCGAAYFGVTAAAFNLLIYSIGLFPATTGVEVCTSIAYNIAYSVAHGSIVGSVVGGIYYFGCYMIDLLPQPQIKNGIYNGAICGAYAFAATGTALDLLSFYSTGLFRTVVSVYSVASGIITGGVVFGIYYFDYYNNYNEDAKFDHAIAECFASPIEEDNLTCSGDYLEQAVIA